MKKPKPKIFNFLLYFFVVVICLAACLLITYLPFRALDTGIVYQGF